MKHSVKSEVYVSFPKVGLGNMMLLWARGMVFAKLHGFDVTVSSWWGLHWGAIIRREKKWRFYQNYFVEHSFFRRALIKLKLLTLSKTYNPDLGASLKQNVSLFIFDKVNIDNDLFKHLRENKSFIKECILSNLHPKIHHILNNNSAFELSLHIRRGDFKLGNILTPLSYFIQGIQIARRAAGGNLSVRIFSDADKEELEPILSLGNIIWEENNPDIADILLMSRSRIIFTSRSSSFSYWGAFLSEALVVIPHDDWQSKIGNHQAGSSYSELRWKESDQLSEAQLFNAIKSIYPNGIEASH